MEILDLFENAEGGVGGREVLEGLREYREGNGMAAMRYVGGVLKCLRNGKKDEEGVKRTRERVEEAADFLREEGIREYERMWREGTLREEGKGRKIIESIEQKGRETLEVRYTELVRTVRLEPLVDRGMKGRDLASYVGNVIVSELATNVVHVWGNDEKVRRGVTETCLGFVIERTEVGGEREIVEAIEEWNIEDEGWERIKTDMLKGIRDRWYGGLNDKANKVWLDVVKKCGTRGSKGEVVEGRMGMKYVCLVDGGIKDVEACRDMIVEGVRGLVEEARAVAGKDGGQGGETRGEEWIGNIYCGMLVFLEHGVIEQVKDWAVGKLKAPSNVGVVLPVKSDLGVTDEVLEGVEGIRCMMKGVDDVIWKGAEGVEACLKGVTNKTKYTVAKERRRNAVQGVEEKGREVVGGIVDTVVREGRDIIKAAEGNNFNKPSSTSSTSTSHFHMTSQLGPYNINDPMSISNDSSPGVDSLIESLKLLKERIQERRSLGRLWEGLMSNIREMFTDRILNGGKITVIGGIVLSRDVDKIMQLAERGGDTLREACVLFVTPPEAILPMVRSMLSADAKIKMNREVVRGFLRRRQDWRGKGGMGRSGWANEIVAEFKMMGEEEEEEGARKDESEMPVGMMEEKGGDGERGGTGAHGSGSGKMFGSSGFGSGAFKMDFNKMKLKSKMWGTKK